MSEQDATTDDETPGRLCAPHCLSAFSSRCAGAKDRKSARYGSGASRCLTYGRSVSVHPVPGAVNFAPDTVDRATAEPHSVQVGDLPCRLERAREDSNL
jgi:hypothetical protein